MAFIKACSEPELPVQPTSPAGLEAAMGLGLVTRPISPTR